MSQDHSQSSSKRRRNNEGVMESHYNENGEPLVRDSKSDLLDIETVDTHDDHLDQDEMSETNEDQQLSEALGFPVNKKVVRGRKRQPLPDNPDGTRQRYYDRYKNMDYVKRNDVYKYCQACKKKVFGRLRSLPSEHRLRRCWILRLNLDVERSAELWSREAFSDATHCGEICQIHFPIGSQNAKNRELMPTDMRMGEEADADDVADANYDFDALELTCVFCGQKNPLGCMVPFVRTRSRRYKWITALSEVDSNIKDHMKDQLKNGASKFLCDWHFNDDDFDINQYGEWRLRKDALPNPMLQESDKKTRRVYMINHGDTILSRTTIIRQTEEAFFQKKDYRLLAQKARRSTYATYYEDYTPYQYAHNVVTTEVDTEHDEEEVEMTQEVAVEHYMDEPLVERDIAGPSTRIPIMDATIEYSDDSDEENDVLEKISPDGKLQETRFCVQCNRFVSSTKSMKEYRPRTWPYDENKHQKWLEFMNYPRNLEDSVKDLWRKRRHAMLVQDYHYTPLSVCQAHLSNKHFYERYDDWLQTYCVLCDVDHGDPNLLLPFPRDQADRLLWLNALTSIATVNQAAEQRWNWLKERLTRLKPTRYRLCVFHFQSTSFVEKDDCVEFNDAALPLPLGLPEYDLTPRGIWAYIKCPLCDEWAEPNDLVDIRSPSSQAERVLLVEMFNGDKTLMKKGVEQLCINPCKVCRIHLPVEVLDPYSVIAERKLVHDIEIQCIQCNHRDIGRRMIPFPFDDEQRRHWIEALSRDNTTKQRLTSRLRLVGRHYLCTSHFHKSALRYIPHLGVWKRFTYLPLAVTAAEREKYLNQEDDGYHALMIAGIDTRAEGVVQELNYDEVMNLFADPNTAFNQNCNRSEIQFDTSADKTVVGGEDLTDAPPILQPERSHLRPDKQIKYEDEELPEEITTEIIEETIEEHIVVDVDHGNYVEEGDDFYE